MSAGCACPYHDAPCANGATATTARYGPLCGQCRRPPRGGVARHGLGRGGMLDVRDEGTGSPAAGRFGARDGKPRTEEAGTIAPWPTAKSSRRGRGNCRSEKFGRVVMPLRIRGPRSAILGWITHGQFNRRKRWITRTFTAPGA